MTGSTTTKPRGLAASAFHRLVRDPESEGSYRAVDRDAAFEEAWESTERFIARFPEVQIEGRSVLDYGCGIGATAIWLAEHGADRVVGIDIQGVDYPRSRLERDYPQHRDRVAFRQIGPGYDVDEQRFDLVLSKDAFEHVDDPDAYVAAMKASLKPGGVIAIGFGPLWKSPWGGHIDFMTTFPWAHLIFPEHVILNERRRFRPDENPSRFEEIRGGLNRMTLAKFLGTMERSGLVNRYIAMNRFGGARSAPRKAFLATMRAASRVPPLREYCTINVYSIWANEETKKGTRRAT